VRHTSTNLLSISSENAHGVTSNPSFIETVLTNLGAVEPREPQPHPQAPDHALPKPVTDFKKYRANAQQHGPLARSGHFPSRQVNMAGAGSPDSADVALDRNELPARFRRSVLTPKEIEYIEVPIPF
jgi:small subunit ribosomal protein YMR-31